jgi:hypothetical protein
VARREPHHRPAAGIESVVAEPRPARLPYCNAYAKGHYA